MSGNGPQYERLAYVMELEWTKLDPIGSSPPTRGSTSKLGNRFLSKWQLNIIKNNYSLINKMIKKKSDKNDMYNIIMMATLDLGFTGDSHRQ